MSRPRQVIGITEVGYIPGLAFQNRQHAPLRMPLPRAGGAQGDGRVLRRASEFPLRKEKETGPWPYIRSSSVPKVRSGPALRTVKPSPLRS
jgi:hypothetical protein